MNESRSQGFFVPEMDYKEIIERMWAREPTHGQVQYIGNRGGSECYNIKVESEDAEGIGVDFHPRLLRSPIIIWGSPSTCSRISKFIAKILKVNELKRTK